MKPEDKKIETIITLTGKESVQYSDCKDIAVTLSGIRFIGTRRLAETLWGRVSVESTLPYTIEIYEELTTTA